METDIIIFFAQKYSITDETTHRLTEGVTVWYYPAADLTSRVKRDGSSKGRKPCKASLSFDMYDKLEACPGLYHAEVEMEANSNNKGVFSIVDLDFTGALSAVLDGGK